MSEECFTSEELVQMRLLHEAAATAPWQADYDKRYDGVHQVLGPRTHTICFMANGWPAGQDRENTALICVMRNAFGRLLTISEQYEDLLRSGSCEEPKDEIDGKPAIEILDYVRRCCECWVPGARLLGNVRAHDLGNACRLAIEAIKRNEAYESNP